MNRMIPSKETLTIEFKSDRNRLPDNDLVEAITAFSNTEGGELYLGVEDDGRITGRHEAHEDFTQLSALVANKTVPPVAVMVDQIDAEFPVIKITVPKSRSIVATSSGKILRRRLKADSTPENIPMYPYEISTRLSELSLLDYSAQPVPNALYSDLDAVERERLRNILRSYHGEEPLLSLDDEELDKALQLATEVDGKLVPTFTGMLLIGKKEPLRKYVPTAEVSFQALSGTALTVNESFHLPILAAIEKIFAFLEARNPEQEMEMGLFRISIPAFDKRAIREAVVNAFVHRDYTRLGRVFVQLSEDGLSISNPGGFIEGVTLENILTAIPHGRNQVLADALKRIGLAERSGRGVDRIFEGSLIYGRPLPDYSESDAANVRLFIPTSLPDRSFVRMISEYQNRTGTALPIISLLILNTLKQGRKMTVGDISEETRLLEARVRAAVERMTEAGLLDAVGNAKGQSYILSQKAYQDKTNHVRQRDIENVRYPELVRELAEDKPTISRKDVAELLRITPPQAYRVLQRMVKAGQLEQLGSGRNTLYRKK